MLLEVEEEKAMFLHKQRLVFRLFCWLYSEYNNLFLIFCFDILINLVEPLSTERIGQKFVIGEKNIYQGISSLLENYTKLSYWNAIELWEFRMGFRTLHNRI